MSSSRDHIILTGCPTALAISTACRTKSCDRRAGRSRRRASSCALDLVAAARRRPRPPPPGRLRRSASAPRPRPCRRSTCAVQFCGSIVAWLRYGAGIPPRRAWPPWRSAASTSPSLRRTGRLGAASPARSNSAIVSLRTLPVAAVVPVDRQALRAPVSRATSCRRRPRRRRAAHDLPHAVHAADLRIVVRSSRCRRTPGIAAIEA